MNMDGYGDLDSALTSMSRSERPDKPMGRTPAKAPGRPWARPLSQLLFDRRDYELIRIVNDVCSRGRDLAYLRRQYYSHFHPHGIKEMAESRSLRIAYAMVHLLTSLEVGGEDERLSALRSLRAEVLDTAEGPMPRNTARVLMQIIKEVVRAPEDPRRQLQLAHDFRITVSGKPRVVRRQLLQYHLLEMPEEWNQISFDDHVHDVNTKGRKSSTHLIMDAWIKGIRRLRVVYYNYIEPRFAAELLEAAHILEIDIRIGIEFSARFGNKYVNLIWAPRGFPDSQAFLGFLAEPGVVELMNEGRSVSAFQQAYVMALLKAFNEKHLPELARRFQIDLPAVDEAAFLKFVGSGQKSVLHLEKFIYQLLLSAMRRRGDQLRSQYTAAPATEKARIAQWFQKMNQTDLGSVVAEYLKPSRNPEIPNPAEPRDDANLPTMLKRSPAALVKRLALLQTGYRITLNLSNLEIEDVLELIYDCEGKISRLELFNLKDWTAGQTAHIPAISRLQEVINGQSPIALKRMILDIIQAFEIKELADKAVRLEKLKKILHDMATLQVMYKGKPLKARIGSDSTGRSRHFHGMGLAVIETLPRRVQKQIRRNGCCGHRIIPIHIAIQRRLTFNPRDNHDQPPTALQRFLEAIPLLRRLGYTQSRDWAVQGNATRMASHGNVITLGGAQARIDNQLHLDPERPSLRQGIPWAYFNSHLRNLLKVFIGFVPAFATFALTKQWWVLAYLGAVIWFGITGIRNILQSVLGGGGLRRSPLLRWNAYVSWDRISDSLLFTGFSVPLLDFLVKTVLLDRLFHVTTATHPLLLYAVMALVNGIYLSSHNALRGLPRGAIWGNFFRSVLSIPIALLINTAAGGLLAAAGVEAVAAELQKWAAIISKTASDLVAGVIEGAADRFNNLRMRSREYQQKLSSLLDIYCQLELLFPETRVLEVLENQESFQNNINNEVRDLEKIIAIHALDLLYFWMYQPRGRDALNQLLNTTGEEERQIWITAQFTLLRQREISQMFIDGVLGDDFAKALAFYLSRSPEYMEAIKRFA